MTFFDRRAHSARIGKKNKFSCRMYNEYFSCVPLNVPRKKTIMFELVIISVKINFVLIKRGDCLIRGWKQIPKMCVSPLTLSGILLGTAEKMPPNSVNFFFSNSKKMSRATFNIFVCVIFFCFGGLMFQRSKKIVFLPLHETSIKSRGNKQINNIEKAFTHSLPWFSA